MKNITSDAAIRPSVCPLDCPDCCSLAVSVIDEQVVEVRGTNANPYTAGVICNKVSRYYPEFVHGETRLTAPLQRIGKRGDGKYREISWDNALDLVHEGFSKAIDKYGSQSVMPFNYAGPHGELAAGSMDFRFFHKLGATQLDRGPLCGKVRGRAYTSLYGAAPGMPPEQAVHADLIVVWGNNVTVSNLHLIRVIKQARDTGAKLIVIDPKRTKVAEQSDLHLAIQPGTDVVFAMAVAAELERQGKIDTAFVNHWTHGYEQYMDQARKYSIDDVQQLCGLTIAQFNEFIAHYSSATTVAVSVGNGIERGKSGGSGLRAAMALQALTGNHGRLGAGVLAKAGLITPKTTDKLQRPDLMTEPTRIFNIVDVSNKLLNRNMKIPLKAIMIYNHNPVCTHPDQQQMIEALSQEDLFIAGSDIVMTDSMRYADVILPAASHFEYADIYGSYGQNYLQRAEPVIACVGETLPNTEIFRRLAKRFGFDDPAFNDTDKQLMDAAINASDKRLKGSKPSEIPLTQAIELKPLEGSETILCDTVLPQTASGKIELYSEALEQQYGFGVPRYDPATQDRKFVLISPSSSKRTNATFGGCRDSKQTEVLEMNPDDANALQLASGTTVLVSNDLGEVSLQLEVTDAVRSGVLYSPKGTWLETSATGRTVNALINADTRTDIESGACYNETFVDVRLQATTV